MDTVIKTIVVDADFKLYVPNAFTPDGDGLNDIFQPKGRGIAKYHLTIYDRWGTVVYQSEDFSKGWDGGEKGKQLTDEVFTWRIYATDVNGKIKELTGFVTLVR
jgi:gliding motility-associated-like protein